MTRRLPGRRPGVSAVELLLASAILAAAFVPIYTLIQGGQRSAYLNELQVLARRRAFRALAYLGGHPYPMLRTLAVGGPPPGDIPFLPTEGSEIEVPLPTGESEREFEAAPGTILDSYVRRVDSLRLKVFFHELQPGLGRLAAVSRWEDPTNRKPRYYVALRYVSDPLVARSRP